MKVIKMKTLSKMYEFDKIATNSPLDKLLDGGIEKRSITQIYGPPGSGKTNISLLLAVNVAKSGKKVVYIDTEGGISIERIKQLTGEDFEKVANNIIVFEPTTFYEQYEDLKLVDSMVSSKVQEIELIILDSAVALFRVEEDKNRANYLGKQMSILSSIARLYDLAVVVTNQIYSSFEEDSDEIKPIGGTVLQYNCKTIIELKRNEEDKTRIALLKRHKYLVEGLAIHFTITDNGIE